MQDKVAGFMVGDDDGMRYGNRFCVLFKDKINDKGILDNLHSAFKFHQDV